LYIVSDEEQKIVVIGASAGGVDALMQLVRALPKNFAAPVCAVLHLSPDSPSMLAEILARSSPMRVVAAEDGAPLKNGTVYVAVPDRHLIVGKHGSIRVMRGPRENLHRPAVDPLFRSAAAAYGARAIGVVLTGNLDDGTAGMIAIKKRGGIAIIQDPRDAIHPAMPQNVLNHTEVDACLPLRAIAAELVRRVNHSPGRDVHDHVELMERETRIAELDDESMSEDNRPGKPSAYSCPECGGVLWKMKEGNLERYRCRVGHAYSPESLLDAQNEQLEEALWSAMKTLEENADLARRLAEDQRGRGHLWMVSRFEERAREAHERSDLIRRVLLGDDSTVPVDVPAEVQG
jgi:two-component system chemotaxis response regulator CheB